MWSSLNNSTIILSGGGSLIPGLKERLKIELQKFFPPKINPNINVIAVQERDNMAWIGASILFLKKQLVKGWINNPNIETQPDREENQENVEDIENNETGENIND